MTWDPNMFRGGFQPGGIMGGPGQGPAAGGGMPSLNDFWSGLRDRGQQFHGGLQNARMNFRDGLVGRLGQLPAAFGMAPRPGGTAGGGWAFPGGGMGRFQMPQGFAAGLPWGSGAGPGATGGPGAAGGSVPAGAPAGAPANAPPRGSPQWQAQNHRPMGGGGSTGSNSSAGKSSGGGGYMPKDPGAADEVKRKAEEIGKKAKGY